MTTPQDLMMDKLQGSAAVVDFLTPIRNLDRLVKDMFDRQASRLTVSKEEKAVLAQYTEELNTAIKNLQVMLFETDLDIPERILSTPRLTLEKLEEHYEFKLYVVQKEAGQ